MPYTLTEKQAKLLKFVQQHIDLHGYMPSGKTMAEYCECSAMNITHLMKTIEKKGWVTRMKGSPNSIEILHRLEGGND